MLRRLIAEELDTAEAEGGDIAGLRAKARIIQSLEQADALLTQVRRAPKRADWPWREPDAWEEAAAGFPCPDLPLPPVDQVEGRVKESFLASVAGCTLGKPLEFNFCQSQLKALLEPLGHWPITGYIPQAAEPAIAAHAGHDVYYWNRTFREAISYVMPDDDLNYRFLGILLMEAYGDSLTTAHVSEAWEHHLPVAATFGPERTALSLAGLRHEIAERGELCSVMARIGLGDPRGAMHCGAQIRTDAYAWACPGRPAQAARLAWVDARLTHRGTGLYAAMWTAASLALSFAATDDPLEPFRLALAYVPKLSRFAAALEKALDLAAGAASYERGCEAIHAAFGRSGCGSHCRVIEESASLLNTLRWAEDPGHGLCLQAMQGSDTDSYCAIAGSLLGARFGPGSLDRARWIEPFRDDLRTAMAWFPERSLDAVAERAAALPGRLARGERRTHTLPE